MYYVEVLNTCDSQLLWAKLYFSFCLFFTLTEGHSHRVAFSLHFDAVYKIPFGLCGSLWHDCHVYFTPFLRIHLPLFKVGFWLLYRAVREVWLMLQIGHVKLMWRSLWMSAFFFLGMSDCSLLFEIVSSPFKALLSACVTVNNNSCWVVCSIDCTLSYLFHWPRSLRAWPKMNYMGYFVFFYNVFSNYAISIV